MSAIAGRVLLIPKGAYNALTTYNPLDFVTYGANSYVCKQTSTGNAPTNTTYWQLMAQGATNANNISYDNTASGLASTDVQGAIDEVVSDTNDALSDISDVISKNGAKNLLPNDYPTQAKSGLTITHNSDHTLSISGNASASVDETISSFKLQAGTYKLSGCPANGDAGKYLLYLYYEAPSSTFVRDYGNGETFTLTSETTIIAKFVVYASYGNGLVFKPMITLASQPDSDYAHYVPYAMTNRELTFTTISDGFRQYMFNSKMCICTVFVRNLSLSYISGGSFVQFDEIPSGVPKPKQDTTFSASTYPYISGKTNACIGQIETNGKCSIWLDGESATPVAQVAASFMYLI